MKPSLKPEGDELGPLTPTQRRRKSYELRKQIAKAYLQVDPPAQVSNGDDDRYKKENYYASFTKGLPHDSNGEVKPVAYERLKAALESGDPKAFEAIPLGSASLPPAGRLLLVDPQCGLAFDTEGIDSRQLTIDPCYTFDSAGEIGEIAENYWMALCRDVPICNYGSDPLIGEAVSDLNKYAQFDGPKEKGKVTRRTIFRGFDGDVVGPYLSQFMIMPIPYGSQRINQQLAYGLPAQDFMKTEAEWLSVQNGVKPAGPPVAALANPHIIASGRNLGDYVHIDELFQAYLNACLLMITPLTRNGFNVPLDPGNPYVKSKTQAGFGTLGEPNFKSLVAEVATRALKAVWFQKWFVHRRLRPEAFGGRIHYHLAHGRPYNFHQSELAKLEAGPLKKVFEANKTYLLPMAFPEGCPVHPAYGAGHATVAGACVTVLKALFKEEATWAGDLNLKPMVPDAAGSGLVPYTGKDASQMTVGGELNKLAANIGLARNFAGVHWRSDYTASVKLGEQVAVHFLQDYCETYNERFSCSITLFSGKKITIKNSH